MNADEIVSSLQGGMLCEDCPLGKTERVVGNGITEPPYLFLVRCPFDKEFYKYPDDDCVHQKERSEASVGQNI